MYRLIYISCRMPLTGILSHVPVADVGPVFLRAIVNLYTRDLHTVS